MSLTVWGPQLITMVQIRSFRLITAVRTRAGILEGQHDFKAHALSTHC